MTSIAKFRRRRRDSDSSSDSVLSSYDTDDTNSCASSDQSCTNASELDSSVTRRPSTSTTDSHDSDSDQQSITNTDDEMESSCMNNTDTIVNNTPAVDHRGRTDTTKLDIGNRSTLSTSNSQQSMDTPRIIANHKDSTYTNERTSSTNTYREKKLWWGEGSGNETAGQRRPSSYSPNDTTYSASSKKDRYDIGWRSTSKQKKSDTNWRNGDNDQQHTTSATPPSRSDWRSQLSPTSDDRAASHWTMASIDQHLLETKIDETNWKRKQQEAKHDAEWPSLRKQQQQPQHPQQESHNSAPLASTLILETTATSSSGIESKRSSADTLNPTLLPTKTQSKPETSFVSEQPQQSIPQPDNPSVASSGHSIDDTAHPDQLIISADSWGPPPRTAGILDSHPPSKSWSTVVKLPKQETAAYGIPAPDITCHMHHTGSSSLPRRKTTKTNKNTNHGSNWGKWPQTLDDDDDDDDDDGNDNDDGDDTGANNMQQHNGSWTTAAPPANLTTMAPDADHDAGGSSRQRQDECKPATTQAELATMAASLENPSPKMDDTSAKRQWDTRGLLALAELLTMAADTGKRPPTLGDDDIRTNQWHLRKQVEEILSNLVPMTPGEDPSMTTEPHDRPDLLPTQRQQPREDSDHHPNWDKHHQQQQQQQQPIKVNAGDYDGNDDNVIRIALPPRHIPKTIHGYLDNKRTSRVGRAEQDTFQQIQNEYIGPSAINSDMMGGTGTVVSKQQQQQSPRTPPARPLVSLSEYTRQGPRTQLPMDEVWWRMGNREELKESQMEQRQDDPSSSQQQTYFYIPPWTTLSFPTLTAMIPTTPTTITMTTTMTNLFGQHDDDMESSTEWMTPSAMDKTLGDDPDYNRYQIPYTTPSGYHGPSSRSSYTPYFGVGQPNTLFY